MPKRGILDSISITKHHPRQNTPVKNKVGYATCYRLRAATPVSILLTQSLSRFSVYGILRNQYTL
ncbi:hypothetical protein ADIS_1210 [Lunatimonas lonarensis]|uniref:Uncharacterized protein n=1 Tax=Lunatimonas lonarensis TaxID=1232681 RepID=R7ZW84_9BACT|nr:hypothetical protein ADIS_1210 [Lunatimonas lonarensis]